MSLYAKSTTLFVQFIKENGFTALHVHKAYLQLVGGSEFIDPDPAIHRIMEKMEEMTTSDEGFPLTRFTALIKKEDFKSELGTYYACVDTFHISEKEKRMLRSIVDQNRKGELDCFVEGKNIATFKIKKNDDSEKKLADELTQNFEKLRRMLQRGKRYEFRFTEN
jgi:hypothetical protein